MAFVRYNESLRALFIICALAAAHACGDNDGLPDPKRDAGEPEPEPEPEPKDDAGSEESDAGELDCFEDPQRYVEIINACTDAEYVEKDPELPQLLPDGTLPPLP